MDVDELLRGEGERWRMRQPPAPQPAFDRVSGPVRGTRDARMAVLAALAVLVVVAAGVMVVARRGTPQSLDVGTPGPVTSAPPTDSPATDLPLTARPDLATMLSGRRFRSTAVVEDGQVKALARGEPIQLNFGAGTLGWLAACNSSSGDLRFDGSTLVLSGSIISTMMGCTGTPDPEAQDEWLATFLRSEPTVDVDGGRLRLTGPTIIIELVEDHAATASIPP